MFSILEAAKLYANKKNSSFGCHKVESLRHVISKYGVEMDTTKVEAVLQWPTPKSVKALQGFLGLTGHYRRCVRCYGKKGNFVWSAAAQQAFEELMHNMTTAPVLAMPGFSQPFLIECDALGRGTRAVLMQQKQPIAFFSKALYEANLNKSVFRNRFDVC